MNDFLPVDYHEPVQSNYAKLVDGDNTFRILSSAIVGYEYWKTITKEDGKEGRTPVRKYLDEKIEMSELETNQNGDLETPKVFWSFVVYNFNDQRIQILELTQKTIRKAIQSLIGNKKWGNPKDYNICVTKSGQKLETEYQINPEPKEELDKKIIKEYEDMKIELDLLFENGDPFKNIVGKEDKNVTETTTGANKAITANDDDIDLDSIPF